MSYFIFYILFVGAVFILNPTSTGESTGSRGTTLSLLFFSSKFGRVLLLDVEKCVLDLYSILTVLKVACCRVCFYVIEWSMFIAVLLLIVCLLVLMWHQRKIELLLHPSSLACLNSSLIVYSCPLSNPSSRSSLHRCRPKHCSIDGSELVLHSPARRSSESTLELTGKTLDYCFHVLNKCPRRVQYEV
jgi:hypothetical protein